MAASVVHAVSMDYRLSFDGVLDNREYGVESLNDETFFFARGAVEVGLAVDDENRVWAGVMPTVWFGTPDTARLPLNALMYFQHESNRVRFRFGAFPRAGALDRLPPWLFGDEAAYRRPYAHGAAVDVGGFGGLTAGAWVDWTGLRDTAVNEAFLFGYGLSYINGAFFARHDFMMYHFALPLNPAPGDAVRDNGGASAEIGAAWGKIHQYIDTAAISIGAIASLDRDRADMVWHNPTGGFINGFIGYGMLALRGFYYAGQAQRLAWGGCFYNYSGIESFGRGDVIIRFFNKYRNPQNTNLRAELTASFYLLDGKFGTSQHFVLSVDYGTYPK